MDPPTSPSRTMETQDGESSETFSETLFGSAFEKNEETPISNLRLQTLREETRKEATEEHARIAKMKVKKRRRRVSKKPTKRQNINIRSAEISRILNERIYPKRLEMEIEREEELRREQLREMLDLTAETARMKERICQLEEWRAMKGETESNADSQHVSMDSSDEDTSQRVYSDIGANLSSLDGHMGMLLNDEEFDLQGGSLTLDGLMPDMYEDWVADSVDVFCCDEYSLKSTDIEEEDEEDDGDEEWLNGKLLDSPVHDMGVDSNHWIARGWNSFGRRWTQK